MLLNIKFHRIARDSTQFDVSRTSGISQGRYSMIERGLIEPTPEERARLAQFLEAPASSLFRPACRVRSAHSQHKRHRLRQRQPEAWGWGATRRGLYRGGGGGRVLNAHHGGHSIGGGEYVIARHHLQRDLSCRVLVVGYKFFLVIPPGFPTKQFIAFRNTSSGGTTTVTLNAWLALVSALEELKTFGKGYVITG